MAERFSVALLLVLLTIYLPAGEGISCRDESGNEVDWWIIYKLPKMDKDRTAGFERHSLEEFIYEGLAYAFITSDHPSKYWNLSQLSIGDEKSMPGRTLADLYKEDEGKNLFHVMYNDEHPHGPTSFTRGHTKGLVLGDSEDSIWFIHSVPHFPPFPNETYGYPHTGQLYGQSGICISTKSKDLDKIGKQLTFNNPFIYSTFQPEWLEQYQFMVKASHGRHVKKAPFYNTEIIKSKNGEAFTTFAKYTDFGKDLYADLVAPALRVPLLVETWPNGRGKMNSSCEGPFIVENVNEMDFPEIQNDDFTTTHDHSKWAISLDKKRPFICIGDINRMETQLKRGGGTACFRNYTVWKAFKKSIKDVETCPRSL